MKSKPQNVASVGETWLEAREQKTQSTKQMVQSEVEEVEKNNRKSRKSAQKQHDAQPEAAIDPRRHIETQAPAKPGAEENVPGRRRANEFALNVSEAAMLHMAHRELGYLADVQEAAYERIYESERLLCGHIVQICNVPAVNLSSWWRAFEVDGLWFVLEPRDPPRFSKVREYELLPALGPTPNDDLPPTLTRLQTSAPPDYIGPRRRRNRGDTNGSRTNTLKPSRAAKGKRKRNEVKRMLTELYRSTRDEVRLLSQSVAQSLVQSWCEQKPRLLQSLAQARRLVHACGSALYRKRDDVASLVQTSRQFWVFFISGRKALTSERQRVLVTSGPTGRLQPSSAGYVVSPRLRLNSFVWDEGPTPDDLFGALWPPNWFGALEEEVFA